MDTFVMQNEEQLLFEDQKIIISKSSRGRKINLFISGWNISKDEMKNHLKNLKRSLGCNGSIKVENIEGRDETVIHLQGNHTDKVIEYLREKEINESDIIIKE